MQHTYAAIEAGGTKILCAIGTNPNNLQDIVHIPTTSPEETIKKIITYFKTQQKKYIIEALGIASFGPVDLNKNSHTYGYITSTPKLGWKNTNFGKKISAALGNILFKIDTDVNAAALAEGAWGVAKDNDTYIYITVGTGIGVGIIVNNKPVHGLIHPEGGHIILPKYKDDPIDGICPFHKNCLEGLASGTSLETRWNTKAHTLPPHHKAWDLQTHYISLALANFICTISPQKIILGGGVMKQSHLFPKIRKKTQFFLNNYVSSDLITSNKIDNYIVPPKLTYCGLLGGILLAMQTIP